MSQGALSLTIYPLSDEVIGEDSFPIVYDNDTTMSARLLNRFIDLNLRWSVNYSTHLMDATCISVRARLLLMRQRQDSRALMNIQVGAWL